MQKISDLKNVFERFYNPTGPERCGFVLPGDEIHEVPNICPQPLYAFLVATKHIREYVEGLKAEASWHTHPDRTSLMSPDDSVMFRAYPDMYHFVIGNDGVRCYQLNKERKVVLEISDPDPTA